jgi:Tol biopolymer transport system component
VVGNAVELVLASVFERETRARQEVLHGPRHEYLSPEGEERWRTHLAPGTGPVQVRSAVWMRADVERGVEDQAPRRRAPERLATPIVAVVLGVASVVFVARAFRGGSWTSHHAVNPAEPMVTSGLIAFGGPHSQIYTMNPDGSGSRSLGSDSVVGEYGPVWSPDGTRIAFYGYPPGGAGPRYNGGANYDVFVMNADGTGVQDLTTSPGDVASGFYQGDPRWSPDSTKIAFEGEDGLYLMNADGSGQVKIANGGSHSWSPDGTRITFAGNDGVYVMNSDGTGLTRLTSGPGSDDFPAYSPDGTKIAFYRGLGGSQPIGDRAIYVMNADGSGQSVVADFQADTMGLPVWSPDGTKLAFDLYQNETWDIYVVGADGTGLVGLTDDPNRDENTPVWSPDGTRIAFEASSVVGDIDNTGTFDIYAMNPDGTDETRITNGIGAGGFDMSWQALPAQASGPVEQPTPPAITNGNLAFVHGSTPDATEEIRTIGTTNPSATKTLASFPDFQGLSWSPEGTALAFSAADGSGYPWGTKRDWARPGGRNPAGL